MTAQNLHILCRQSHVTWQIALIGPVLNFTTHSAFAGMMD